jgi:hypothetical protein
MGSLFDAASVALSSQTSDGLLGHGLCHFKCLFQIICPLVDGLDKAIREQTGLSASHFKRRLIVETGCQYGLVVVAVIRRRSLCPYSFNFLSGVRISERHIHAHQLFVSGTERLVDCAAVAAVCHDHFFRAGIFLSFTLKSSSTMMILSRIAAL